MFRVLRPSYSGQRRTDFTLRFRRQKVEFASIAYNEKSSLEDKRFEISNLDLIRNMADIVQLEEVSINFILP